MREKATADRLEMTAKLLRSSSQGLVGNARHWMKDAADDCIQAASELRAAGKVIEETLEHMRGLYWKHTAAQFEREPFVIKLRAALRPRARRRGNEHHRTKG